MRRPYWIPRGANLNDFPPLEAALEHPDGLLAVGGDLTPNRIIVAYRLGIFPWYDDDDPILWWSPAQRMVLFPECLSVSRSLRKTIRKNKFTVTMDQNFREVIKECAGPRRKQEGTSTWITDEMREAYCQLHDYGFAHSVESWYEGRLVGGLYGIALGKVFFGESMFSHETDASKVAFAHFVWQLQRWGYELIDCQVRTNHLQSLGAVEIPRQEYRALLDRLCKVPGHAGAWQFDTEEILRP
jgi:leucyl/phenylalanyl-tRNA---protein transferase